MYYADASVLVSYVFETDVHHSSVKNMLENMLKSGEKLCTSTYTLTEVYNTVCRIIERGRLIAPLQSYLDLYRGDPKGMRRFMASLVVNFLIEKLGIAFIEHEDLYRVDEVGLDARKIGVALIFREAVRLSPLLLLRIKDLLHVAYAYLLSKLGHNIKAIVTCDRENFGKVKDVIKEVLDIEVVLPP